MKETESGIIYEPRDLTIGEFKVVSVKELNQMKEPFHIIGSPMHTSLSPYHHMDEEVQVLIYTQKRPPAPNKEPPK